MISFTHIKILDIYIIDIQKVLTRIRKCVPTDEICTHEQVVRGSLNKFPDFFPVGTFIDSAHLKL